MCLWRDIYQQNLKHVEIESYCEQGTVSLRLHQTALNFFGYLEIQFHR